MLYKINKKNLIRTSDLQSPHWETAKRGDIVEGATIYVEIAKDLGGPGTPMRVIKTWREANPKALPHASLMGETHRCIAVFINGKWIGKKLERKSVAVN